MKNRVIILTFLLLQCAISIHVSNHVLEITPIYDENTYLQGLEARQTNLKDSMAKITQLINNLKNKISSQQNDTQS